jgi:hypothetical protein
MLFCKSLLVFIFVHVSYALLRSSAARQKDVTISMREQETTSTNNLQQVQALPGLLDVTLEQLNDGLAKRRFTSVDLVNVSLTILILILGATIPEIGDVPSVKSFGLKKSLIRMES